MADFDFTSGASGAASGASIGTSIAPGIGTAIGAGVGFLGGGFLGGGDENDALQQQIKRSRSALADLTQRRDEALEASPTETSLFQQGATQLQEEAERQAQQDASQAAARGLEGSQFEVAQDQNRAEAVSKGLQGLLTDAERFDRQKERRLDQQVQEQRSALSALVSDRAAREQKQDARQNQVLFSTLSQAAPILADTDFSGLFGSESENTIDGLVDPQGDTSGFFFT